MRRRAFISSCLAAAALAGDAAWAQTQAPYHAGFGNPKGVQVVNAGIVSYSKALVVDLDNNGGAQEIVVGTKAGRLIVFNHDGSIRAGWAPLGQTMPSEIASSPAAGQLDNDQPLEIVVGCGTANPGEERGQVAAFNADGTVLWRFDGLLDIVEGPDGQPDAVYSTPALGDLDDDGRDDVVFGSFDHRVYALKGTNGAHLPGWPVSVRETIWSSPALADLDGNGTLEIVIGADVHTEPPPINTPTGGALWIFRRNGSQFPGFPRFVTYAAGQTPVGIFSSPVVGDITGDGCPEIVVGTGPPAPPFSNTAGRMLHAWSWNGSIPPGWPVALLGHSETSPALANLDGDAALEVVATATRMSSSNPWEGWLHAVNGDGAALPGFPVRPTTAWTGTPADSLAEAIVVRFGAGSPDASIFVGGVGFDVAHISRTGVQLSENGQPYEAGKLMYDTNRQVFGPAAADLDDNGTLVLVGASGYIVPDPDDLGVYAWNLGPAVGPQPWPMYRQDPRRRATAPDTTGCAVPSPPLDFYTVTPCRISDSRDPGNFTYGGPQLVANEDRAITIVNTPYKSCGVPPTAKAVVLNVTVTSANADGFLRVYPAGDGIPATSTINFKAGQSRSNSAVLPLSFDGRGNLSVNVGMPPGGRVHVILDVFGYFQ
ncbi:MAG TPA: VCBS repeat-containing protein [Thermoanaerobaculia bacterium]